MVRHCVSLIERAGRSKLCPGRVVLIAETIEFFKEQSKDKLRAHRSLLWIARRHGGGTSGLARARLIRAAIGGRQATRTAIRTLSDISYARRRQRVMRWP
jgi:hypothetical protein